MNSWCKENGCMQKPAYAIRKLIYDMGNITHMRNMEKIYNDAVARNFSNANAVMFSRKINLFLMEIVFLLIEMTSFHEN
jgi:hypothetical protein